jgi:hypothetical protein
MRLFDAFFGNKNSRTNERSPEESSFEASFEAGNPVLIRAMYQVATSDTPENRMRVHSALLASVLLVPVPEIPAGLGPGVQTAKAPVPVQLTGIVDAHNVRITPAFTDIEALRNWDPNTPYFGIKALELFRLVLTTDIQAIIVNPFDPIRKMIRPGGRVTRSEIEILARGVAPTEIGHNTAEFRLNAGERFFFGLPANPPSDVIQELLRKEASAFPAIAELYYFQMATERGGSHTVIGIDLGGTLTRTQQQGTIRSLGETVRTTLKSTESLDFMFLSGSFGNQVREKGVSFFRKSS